MSVIAREVLRLGAESNDPITILDLGFGSGAHWGGVQLPDEVKITAIDASPDWVASAVEPKPHEVVIGVVPKTLESIPNGSYDIVMAFDPIEHLPKHEGYMLLYEMQRISRSMAVIYTPNGLLWQPPSPDNEWNAHISGWIPRELRNRGWTEILGWRGARWMVGPYSRSRLSPRSKLGRFAADAMAAASRPAIASPRLSYSFTAIVRNGRSGHTPYPDDAWNSMI